MTQIKLPVGARTSIGQRITGVVLGINVPIAIYLLQRSLGDEADFVLRISDADNRLTIRGNTADLLYASFALNLQTGGLTMGPTDPVSKRTLADRRGNLALALCRPDVFLPSDSVRRELLS